MRLTLIIVAILILSSLAVAAAGALDLSEYLPDDVTYDPEVPTPKDVLGTEVGEWHVRHDQLLLYLNTIAGVSDRVRIETTGKTHEDRPIVVVTVSSPDNLARLENIRQKHVDLTRPGAKIAIDDAMPAVVWLCYSVHGNEASGSNASLVTLYHLAAAQGSEVDELLKKTVILIDPSLNPDGLDRFAGWVNRYRGRVLNPDPQHREHREAWPNGRTNHYWFDLNRDWLLLTHPESRARIETYHRWKPNMLLDFHEMGTDATYFFQPGVLSRKHPLTPTRNVELTEIVAGYHADILDGEGRLYYTQERFDDFYYGKGSTYPDVNGCVGILFEQASARGHRQKSINGEVTLPFAIKNQFLTTLSSLKAAQEQRRELLVYQQEFFDSALELAARDRVKNYVFGDVRDPGRTRAMLDILLRHDIEVYELGSRLTENGVRFDPKVSYAVPARQAQYRLVKSIFEQRTDFADSLFYDVSAWTIPLSMGVPFAAVTGSPRLGNQVTALPATASGAFTPGDAGTVAYAFSWEDYRAPRVLGRLLGADIKARVSVGPFSAKSNNGNRSFEPGTILVPLGIQTAQRSVIEALLSEAADQDGVVAHPLTTGLTPSGADLGSPSMRHLKAPRPLLLIGEGISSTEAGEVWHLLDRRFDLPVTLVEKNRLPRVKLDTYTHLLMVNGSYGDLDEDMVARIKTWIEAGGVLMASKSAVSWVKANEWVPLTMRTDKADEPGDDSAPPSDADKDQIGGKTPRLPYGEHDRISGAQVTGGAIFAGDVDRTHPLGFGYTSDRIHLFRNSNLYADPIPNPYGTVVRYTESPLASGYISPENLERAKGSAAVVCHRMGRGCLVLYLDNPNFRGVWYGTNKLYLNGLFFGPVIDRTAE